MVLPFLLFALLASASVGMWSAMSANEERALRDVTDHHAAIAASRIQGVIDSRVALLELLAARISYNGLDEAQFNRLVTQLRDRFPGLAAVAWVDQHEVLRWVSPETSQTNKLLGHRTPALRTAPFSLKAASTGLPVASPPFQLGIGGRGFILIVPVQRDKTTYGRVGGTMLVQSLVDLALLDTKLNLNFSTHVFDGDIMLYSNDDSPGVNFASREQHSDFSASSQAQVLDRTWTVVVFARPDYVASVRSHPKDIVLIGGLLLSAGVAFMFWRARIRRTQAEENRERFQDFAESSSDWLWEMDVNHNITYMSSRAEEHLEYPIEFFIGKSRREVPYPELNPPAVQNAWRQTIGQLQPLRDFVCRMKSATGKIVVAKMTGIPKFDRQGRFLGYRGSSTDITAERTAQENAHKAQQRLFAAIEALPAAFLLYDPDGKLLLWNRYVDAVYPGILAKLKPGMSHDEVTRNIVELLVPGTPQDKAKYLQARLSKFQDANAYDEVTLSNGHVLRIIDWRTSDGSTVGLRFDITEAKQRDAELRQAQKMEAVGQLTGGIAHDFNNMLQVIAGYTELAKHEIGPAHPAIASIDAIGDASLRAADLTRQLLSFSRKQVPRKRELDLNRVVSGITNLMERLLSGNMELKVHAADILEPIVADRGMIEQVLMNLAVNSRDAMPDGGHIELETVIRDLDHDFCRANPWAKQGRYVALRFSDTGSGMSREVIQHAFEPFFTTKGVGKGTGLGLSTVYGIVQQHEGLIHIDSEPEKGTTIWIYFPVAGESAHQDEIASG